MATVDLSELPPPEIIATLDYETILSEVKVVIIAAYPEDMQPAIAAAMALESEPLNVIAQVIAYRELMLRQVINDGAAACMLSHATGNDLDNLAANNDTERLTVIEETDTTDAVMESDAALRMRAQSAFEGLSVAGPTGAYEYFAKSASGKVADVKASSPAPAEVVVSVLSAEGDGTASDELIATVNAKLSDESVRPVGDRLTVQSAEIISYDINVTLYLYPGPESEPIVNAAEASLQKWLKSQWRIGLDVARSAIMAALHVQGVQRVELDLPERLIISDTQAARCASVTITRGGTDE
ncbi:baseplate J/gp47 family protein [Salmonella enterica]|uniref:baseplate assembly protein n=1 Tax=Enterobacteriaceae TaxID=543 RepID=UPI0004DA9758|nr:MULTISPECIES: baseplate J/gp47 family protein [Enterobacteriaceae]EAY5299847.1 baseplate assembly protein [Salmonella enterica]ECI2309540.1 baseplate assembly protein [Salmonella enterica subsp. enterica serovar Infantis]EDN2303601.1 baseplate assembly protein [Salmonella enterica subsp. diarizonae serovar 65:(k):z]EDW4290054.1 baseplate assembly protein [Salmonella enterica subsp. diarizonae]EGO1766588.1 baseplate assembly protein [Salmonella enterica subsp. diarizonae serovar Rough:-:-]H